MAEPGWYPDPSGTVGLRFWDGRRWTDEVSAAADPTPVVLTRSTSTGSRGPKTALAARIALITTVALTVGATAAVPVAASGAGLTTAAIVAAAVTSTGVAGAVVSLRLAKPIARRVTGATTIHPSPDADGGLDADGREGASDHPTTDVAGDPPADRAARADDADEGRAATERWLVETVGRLADGAGITRPEVAVYPSPTMNAFATGPTRNAAMVAVSDRLIVEMSQPELCAVLAHEVAHVANGDMVTATMAQGVLNTFVVAVPRAVGGTVQRLVGRGGETCSRVGSAVLGSTIGLPAGLLVMWASRRREYRADEGAAQLVGLAPVIGALTTLRDTASSPGLAPEVASLGVRSGHTDSVFRAIRSSHPDINLRIASLDL